MLFPSSHLVSASCAVFSAPPPQPPILLLLPELSRGEAAWGEASVAALRSPPAPHNSAAAGAPLLLLRALVSAARTALYNYTWPIHTTPQQYTGPTVSHCTPLHCCGGRMSRTSCATTRHSLPAQYQTQCTYLIRYSSKDEINRTTNY